MKPHGQPFFKLLYVQEGTGHLRLGPREIATKAGDLFLIAPHEIHDLSGLKGCKVWLLAFKAEALVEESTRHSLLNQVDDLVMLAFLSPDNQVQNHFQISEALQPLWLSRLRHLHQELEERRVGFSESARSLLSLLLIDVVRLSTNPTQSEFSRLHPLLRLTLCYIASNYHKPISLADVAHHVKRSPAYLTDLVRRETGKTVLAWIMDYRMVEARRLLMTTQSSIQEVAEAVGYVDAGHFNRLYRKLHGVPPQVWRQTQRNLQSLLQISSNS
ncbi:MAG: helix-turn-helix transcriptional regulator [Anaerolineae bacterium]|nr:helix-turn-helix transcriptional regulator [Gloeobacterales cyanobacterium ES-bin-313]